MYGSFAYIYVCGLYLFLAAVEDVRQLVTRVINYYKLYGVLRGNLRSSERETSPLQIFRQPLKSNYYLTLQSNFAKNIKNLNR